MNKGLLSAVVMTGALLTVSYFFLLTQSVEAKVLPQAQKSVVKAPAAKSAKATTGIGVSPKIRADRRALNVSFSNLQNATAVSYLLTYTTNSQQEGAMGSLNLNGSSSTTNELLFGTCSKNVCRYHTGIKDARLEVNYTTKTGKKYLKKFRVKI